MQSMSTSSMTCSLRIETRMAEATSVRLNAVAATSIQRRSVGNASKPNPSISSGGMAMKLARHRSTTSRRVISKV